MPIDHVTATVSDFETGKSFYSAALKPLGYDLQMEFGGSAAGFGPPDKMPDFWIGGDASRGASHIAFTAPDRATVDAFYEAAMAAGARTTARPGCDSTTTRTTTRPTSTTRTATTSKPSATSPPRHT